MASDTARERLRSAAQGPTARATRARWIVAMCVAGLIAAACGQPDPVSQRVTGSPSPAPEALEEASPDPPTPPADDPTPTPETAVGTVTTPAPDAPAAPEPDLARARVALEQVTTLDQPLALASTPGDHRVFIAEKTGRLVAVDGSSTQAVLDLSSEVSGRSEQGLLGVVFSPDGNHVYVHFTDLRGDTRVREYPFTGGQVVASGAREVLHVAQPFSNHNGGHLAFGPDGYLYVGLGDGGSGGDPQDHGQRPETLLGSMLRIDPRPTGSATYDIPADNPFVDHDRYRAETWAYGLRNPWRYSFDAQTGDLWIADVGQSHREEINFQPAGAGGRNYGWARVEGTRPFRGVEPANHTPPAYEYELRDGNCAVVGGYVYRGERIPDLRGAYLFADHCAGRLRAFVHNGNRATEHRFLGPQADRLSSFGQDRDRELWVMSLQGPVYRIVAA